MVLIGRLTRDAVVKKLKDERQFVTFSIAINDYYKPKTGEVVTLTTYYNCSYWLSTKIVTRLTKGSLVEITGRIKVNAYTALNGEAKASLNCHVNSITIHQHVKATAESSSKKQEVVNDLPF